MNELLKGLIGAEFTLLGIASEPGPSPAAGIPHAPAVARGTPHVSGRDTAAEREEGRSKIGFSQRDYRTAGG